MQLRKIKRLRSRVMLRRFSPRLLRLSVQVYRLELKYGRAPAGGA